MRPDASELKAACEALARIDPALGKAFETCGVPEWRDRPVSYETIATTIAYQQISVKAAAAIWNRVKDRFVDVTPQAVIDASDDDLRSLGLSRPKIRHMKSVAEACASSALDLDRVIAASVPDARAELLSIKGIGPWTAELFLLYARGEMDAFPTADLGLMEAYKRLSGADQRLDKAEFTAVAEGWRPWRGVAAHLLWAWLRHDRSR